MCLHDITFTAKPGETTAIIGSTGSGKSTLVNLIPRFYDVTDGSITLDGVDIREVTQHESAREDSDMFRRKEFCSPEISLLILCLAIRMEAKQEMIEAAADCTGNRVYRRRNRRNMKVRSHRAVRNVSGGQKQRLSIARAIAKHPEVFIFDDSFSALDFKTDVTLRKALKEKTKDSTVLIVAQRISTILHAEQIMVLDDGKVAGNGNT